MVKDIIYSIIDAFKLMGSAIVAVFEFVGSMWRAQFDMIMQGVDLVVAGAKRIGGFFGFGGGDVAAGQQQIAAAAASPLNSATSNSISNTVASTNRENNVQVGQVVVNTQATDANGVAKDIGGSLNDQLAQLDAEFSTGVER